MNTAEPIFTILPPRIVEKLSPADKLVYEYLATGRKLTGMIAKNSLNQGDVRRRITTLTRAGLIIEKTWKRDHFGKRYKEYHIPLEAPQEA